MEIDKNKFTYFRKVAGVTFEGRQDIIAEMIQGQKVVLIPEPNNAYDPRAVGVWCCWDETPEFKREQIGYLDRETAARAFSQIPLEGMPAEVHEITGGFKTVWGE